MLHKQISSALVTRGDEWLARGDYQTAFTYFRRALIIDGDSSDAADRIVFFSGQIRSREALRDAIDQANAFLAHHPADRRIRVDRAFCFHSARELSKAADDFGAVARSARDPELFTLAAWDRYHSGGKARAISLLREALAITPRYQPALHALTKMIRR